MTKKEYFQSRKIRKDALYAKIQRSYKKHYKPYLKPGLVVEKVCKECNVSNVTYYDAIKHIK